ncbi:hypothetical protein Tco_0775090 [Tanacetum coccineum]
MIRMLRTWNEVKDESKISHCMVTSVHFVAIVVGADSLTTGTKELTTTRSKLAPGVTFQETQTDCVQDTAQRMKLKRLKASTALMTRQTDAEQRRPTTKET